MILSSMTNKRSEIEILTRGKKHSVRFRVPPELQPFDQRHRKRITKSLDTDSLAEAYVRAPIMRTEILAELRARAGQHRDETLEERVRRLADLASGKGFHYRPAAQIAAEPLEERLRRIEALANVEPGSETEKAVLGAAEGPPVMLSGLVAYVEDLKDTKDEHRYKSAEQMKRRRQARDRAVGNLRAALHQKLGTDDKPVRMVTAAEAWLHYDLLKKRKQDGEIDHETANRDFGYMGGLLKRYYDSLRLTNPRPYSGIKLTDVHKQPNRKLELPEQWFRDVVFAPDPKFLKLNEEARDITIIAAEIGARQAEVHDAPESAWRLDDPIPHLLIRNVAPKILPDGTRVGGRQIKNIFSDRQAPLVGVALEAARRQRARTKSRYRGKRSFSATVNKLLRENKLFPVPPDPDTKYTIGGGRHAYEGRMKAAGIHLDDRGEMMGHSVKSARNRALYGDKMPLDVRQLIAKLICFDGVSDAEKKAARRELRRRGILERRP